MENNQNYPNGPEMLDLTRTRLYRYRHGLYKAVTWEPGSALDFMGLPKAVPDGMGGYVVYDNRSGIGLPDAVKQYQLTIWDYRRLVTALKGGSPIYYSLHGENVTLGFREDLRGIPVLMTENQIAYLLYQYCKNRYDDKKIENQSEAEKYKEEFGRYRNNILRASSSVEEYGLCNDFDLFITVTVSPDKANRQSLADVYDKVIRGYLRNAKTKMAEKCKKNGQDLKDCDLKYVFVPELHADGKSYHLHGLLSVGDMWLDRYKDYYDLDKNKLPSYVRKKAVNPFCIFYDEILQERIGWNIIEPIRDRVAATRYILKYIRKGFNHMAGKINPGKELYWVSKGLNKKIPVNIGTVDWGRMVCDTTYEGEFGVTRWYHIAD